MYNIDMVKKQIKKMGRPTIDGGYTAQLPRVRLSEKKLDAYKKEASRVNKSLSQWIRNTLDEKLTRGKN